MADAHHRVRRVCLALTAIRVDLLGDGSDHAFQCIYPSLQRQRLVVYASRQGVYPLNQPRHLFGSGIVQFADYPAQRLNLISALFLDFQLLRGGPVYHYSETFQRIHAPRQRVYGGRVRGGMRLGRRGAVTTETRATVGAELEIITTASVVGVVPCRASRGLGVAVGSQHEMPNPVDQRFGWVGIAKQSVHVLASLLKLCLDRCQARCYRGRQ